MELPVEMDGRVRGFLGCYVPRDLGVGSMKAYKGFNPDMTCRGFQYEEGKAYETDKAALCENGFHACENPLDCFGYYSPNNAVYHEVDLDDVSDEKSEEDTKRVAKKIKIGASLSVADICKAHFEYVKERTTTEEHGKDNTNLVGGDRSSLSARNRSSLSARNGSSLSAQDRSSLSAQDGSSLSAGRGCVLAAFNSKAKAGVGSLIALAKREWRGDRYEVVDFAAGIVDGEKIKADTWYTVEDGKLVEVEG